MASDRSWTDRRMDLVIGNLLRSGVVLSALIVLFGAVIYLVRHATPPLSTGCSVESLQTFAASGASSVMR